MTNHPLINRLAVAVLLISAAVLGATAQRDMSSSQTRCACGRSQSPHQSIAHHAGTTNHTNHAEAHR
jgi:hypothetical protein